MVRSYLRHGPTQAFGIITSPTCSTCIYAPASSSSSGSGSSSSATTLAYTAGWEDVLVWDVKKSTLVSMWHSSGVTSPVTNISKQPSRSEIKRIQNERRKRLLQRGQYGQGLVLDGAEDENEDEGEDDDDDQLFAVGHQDGSLRLWSFSPSLANYSPSDPDSETGANERTTFNGHSKAVSSVCWSEDGSRVFSGGMEGNIVVWDAVEEVGLYRLKGHKAPITSIRHIPHPSSGGMTSGASMSATAAHPGYLVTTSKDTFLKLWDLQTQHCIQTVVVGRGEVLSCDVREDLEVGEEEEKTTKDGVVQAEEGEEQGAWSIVTGSGDGEVNCWKVYKRDLATGLREDASGSLISLIKPLGPLPIPNLSASSLTHGITHLAFHPNPAIPLLYIQTADKSLMMLRLRSREELEAKMARRRKRERERAKAKGLDVAEDTKEKNQDEDGQVSAAGKGSWLERVTDWCFVRAGGKIRSIGLISSEDGSNASFQVLLALSNNSLESFSIPCPPLDKSASVSKSAKAMKAASGTGQIEATRTHVLELQGHRNDVRSLSVSSDDQILASASNGSLKIWNLRTTGCIRTMDCGYAICATFLPGDRHVLVGTKSGELELFDIASSTMLESIKAHDGPVWSIDIRAGGGGLVTGSADKDVKIWDIKMKEVAGPGSTIVTRLGEERTIKTKQLSLVHIKTLKMTDDVLAVKHSPDGRLLAVSLLDSTVKIFFADTLKFFLSLYGHKLPVLAMDISYDSKLIITCSADKNVKIWGLDFGDCHKSIFAHEESIMQIAFEHNSHYFWTVGKDKMVKYWDGDKFELIQKLEGHHGEVWALAVSHYGEFVVTGSHDKSIRVWEKTEDPLFLEEEREREMEQMYESGIADTMNREDGKIGDPEGETGAEVEAVQKHTSETLMAGEKIMEAIELADADRQLTRDYEESRAKAGPELAAALMPPTRSALLIAVGDPTPEDYVLSVLQKIPTAQMEDALLVLPFKQVISLLEYLDLWADNSSNIALVTRILFFMLRTHHHQIVSNRIMRSTLLSIRSNLRGALQGQKGTLGYNKAALRYIKRQHDQTKTANLLEEEILDEAKVKALIEEGQKKRKKVGIRS